MHYTRILILQSCNQIKIMEMRHGITIREFNDLHETEKYEIIWKEGILIGKRIQGEFEIILYILFAFYIELYYNMTLHLLKQLKSLSNIKSMDAYNKKAR